MKALAERFSVATPTMREALRRLQANGVVEIRHGSGVYVRNTQERMLLANPSRREVEASTVLHLLDARLLIEPSLTEMTARDADDADVTVLERILEEAEQYLVGNDVMLYRMNMGFHKAIADSSGNPVLAQIVESLIELYSYEQLAIISFYNDRPQDHEEHLGIFAAIRDRDAKRARDLMSRHIAGVREAVGARLSERTNTLRE
jgi:GntR family transcriptional repressor for pyruvate dehydrogenase complex